jgi:2-phosphosulfolactate phosphatase
MRELKAHFLPLLVSPEKLAGAAVVVIDVLRATTTITHALAAGAREVIACLEVDEARQLAARFGKGEALLGGEREGLKIEGFDLGNSPTEFTPESVGGRTIVFSTTNGTRAMMHCEQAKTVLLGALVNRAAVCTALAGEDRIHLLCAGTRGEITREDVLFAGAAIDMLTSANPEGFELNDQAILAADAWRVALPLNQRNSPATREPALIRALRNTQGGRNLRRIGLEADIPDAARLDTFDLVPCFDPPSRRITA